MSVEAVALAALGKYVAGLGKKWAKANARDLGEWRGSAAFTKVSDQVVRLFGLTVGRTSFYNVSLPPDDPLRLYSFVTKHEYRGRLILNESDLGSIHPILRPIGGEMLDLDPAAFKKTYHLHDSVYDEGGVWVRDPAIPKSDWVFVECERVFGDILMLWGLSAEGANNATLQAVYRAVRVAAGKAWENHGKIDNC
jgi:hypothetical protein